MSWYIELKKYRKGVKELLFVRSELEYQEEVLKDTHHEFEAYYRRYCADRDISLQQLNEKNDVRVGNLFKQAEDKKAALAHKPRREKINPTKVFDKIYRAIAKEIHPDKLSKLLPTKEIAERENR